MSRNTLWFVVALLLAASPAVAQRGAATLDSTQLSAFRFRSIGPAVTGGRIHDVEALPNDPATIYVASASGGLWKSTNKGATWTPVFEHEPVSTFGDVAIAPSDPDVVWVGTGEQQNRQSTSWGNGVYRSTDGGASWTHVGLDETRHIARVLVDPRNADVAYVAAEGNLWKASPDRGVFKTADAGRTWRKVLSVDTLTGVVDLVMDPSDPNTLYAAAYQRLRRAWGFNGGGPGSGIYKTMDGGATWQRLAAGLPSGDMGRIGLAISHTQPKVLNALIEHADAGGTYRTEDGGASWQRVNRLDPRPMYYSHIFIDPTNADRVYVLSVEAYRSEDGGKNFTQVPTRPTYDVGVHSDYHTMWIDPKQPKHFYLAGDGGLYETWDMGQTFEKINNFTIGQFYAIGVDMRDPYYIYGGMQDNHSWMGPSATRHWSGIINDDWRQIGFGDGMYWQADPTSHRYVYGASNDGSYARLDAETGDMLDINPQPPAGEEYRFDWTSPLLVSRHDPRTVYLAGNRLFISHDRGESWERTEDLSRRIDRDTLTLMGVKGADIALSRNDGTGSYGEIVTLQESPLDGAILWVGTDDGNVQVSRDGGKTWTEVSRNVHALPNGTYVSRVAPSRAAPGAAWVTFDAHRDGDFRPYVFHTEDFGRTWTAHMQGLPVDGSVNVILEHPDNSTVLFLGTEHALYASLNGGANWTRFGGNLPTTLYDDLLIHPREKDLVVATHGRSIWILDDVAPLAEWSPAVARSDAHVFAIRRATIKQYWKDTSYRAQAAYAGENPPDGAIVTYYLRSDQSTATLVVRRRDGRVVRTLDVSGAAGLHRVVWDLRYAPPPGRSFGGEGSGALPVLAHPIGARGAFVAPGEYTVTLTAGGATATQTLAVRGDPLMPITQTQWATRETFLVGLAEFQEQVAQTLERVGAASAANADSVRAVARALQQLRGQAGRLAGALNGSGVQQGSLYPPTTTQRETWQQIQRDFAALAERIRWVTGG